MDADATMIETGPDLSRTALYARYSSPKQSPKSIPDQLRDCHRLVATLGGKVVAEYTDAEQTGTTTLSRAGLQQLLADCRRGAYSAVCTESLDRISRDQADITSIYRDLQFHNVVIWTIPDGEIGPLHVGLKGTMNALFIRDLSHKTRRGLIGVIESGRQSGAAPYGYRIVNRLEGARVIRGLREIDPETAPVVKRIYALYLDGLSARAIARLLTEENIPTGSVNAQWQHPRLIGGYNATGILSNPIYKGEVTFGRTRHALNPATGKRVTRIIPRECWTVVQAPHLRIIDDDTWHAVQQRLDERSRPRILFKGVPALARGAMPLTPLLRCSRCKGPVRTIARNRWACTTARKGGKCSAGTFVLRDIDHLSARQLTAWVQRPREWNRLLQQARNRLVQARGHLEAELSDRTLRARRLVDIVERGADTQEIRDRLVELGTEIRDLNSQLDVHAANPQIRGTTHEIRPMLLARAQQIQSAIESGAPGTRLPATLELAEVLDHIDMAPGPAPGKARLRIQPNIISLVQSATRALA